MYTYRVLSERVDAVGGLMHASVEDLRDLEGAGKLGTHVRGDIERHLSNAGLRMLEGRIPNDQRAKVWLVSPETTYGSIILDAVVEMRATCRSAA
jgi:hypothetical protein